MILIIAEKPSVMKNIIEANLEDANVKKMKGEALGKNFIYTHCIGHLLTLKYPGEIDPNLIKWDMSVLPFYFDQIPLKVSQSVSEQYKIVERLLLRDDIDEVVNACDSDREGDLIFRNLYHYSKCKCKNVSRMWIESQTKEGIRESFKERLPEKEYNNVYFAGKSRSYADYFIGLNSTRAMTVKFGKKDNVFTIGRVQTPTLRIVCDLEKEILNFKEEKYYKIQAIGLVNGAPIVGNYINEAIAQNRFLNKDDALKMVDKIGLGDAIIKKAETTNRNEKPKMLYSLSDLQVEMDKRYQMSAMDVLNTVQSLYETHKLVSYPRTDETHVSKKLAGEALEIVASLNTHSQIRKEILDNKLKMNPIMIAKKDIGAHEALTPTKMKVTKELLSHLNDNEIKVYMAIVERFLASFLPDAILSKQHIIFTKNNENFTADLELCIEEGHRKAYIYNKKKEEINKKFISAKESDIVSINELKLLDGKTTPPQRFTEGSLIKMMKNPSKYVEDKSDKDVLKKSEGIGTEATRASIIEELKKRELISVDKKKNIKPTDKGMYLIDTIPSEIIKSVTLTAEFERKLDLISKGLYNYKDFLNEIKEIENKFVNELKNMDMVSLHYKEVAICNCPVCNGYVIEDNKSYRCVSSGCKVQILKNARGAKLITKDQAIHMLKDGNSYSKVLCISQKTNKEFEALMTYKYNEGEKYPNQIEFDFNAQAPSENQKSICKCPICGKNIIETPFSFKCENKDCKVNISKNARGIKKMTQKCVTELLKDGITSKRMKCVTKTGNEIEVYLKYQFVENDPYPNHIDYVFETKKDENK